LIAPYRRTAASLAVIAGAATVFGLIAGAAWGWALAAAGLAAMLAYHVVHLARLARWLEDPLAGQVPEASGTWDEVLSALHRYERAAAGREQQLAGALSQLRRAAQAMPDGVVLLDAKNAIEWCNDQAAAMLELDPRADVGRPIANLVREPDFIDYLSLDESARSRPVRISAGQGRVLSIRLIPYGQSQTLLLAQRSIRFRIKEIRMGIENAKHSRNRAVIDGLVGVHGLGVIVLDEGVDVGELLKAILDLGVAGDGRLLAGTLGEQNAQKSASKEKKNYQEERSA